MEKQNEFISIGEVAEKLGIDRANLFTNLRNNKYGLIEVNEKRYKDKGNQKCSVISMDDFNLIKQIRKNEGFEEGGSIKNNSNSGVFYIIKTNPNSIPNRYKFGFSSDLPNRIKSYKSVCPNSIVVESFKCNFYHELPLLKMISKYGKRIGQELYEVEDMLKVIVDIKEVLLRLLPE